MDSYSLTENDNLSKKKNSFFQDKIDYKKFKLKNKIFLSCKQKDYNTSINNSKSNKDLNIRYSKTIDDINNNFNKMINEKFNLKSIFNENFVFDFDTNKKNKKLAIIKNGIIYWLRKLYIIYQNNLIQINNNNIFYFYYPIKDLNMIKNKSNLLQFEKYMTNDNLFCNNLADIRAAIKDFLNINKNYDFFKIILYKENFDLIKTDSQLMEKIERYKILYAKITKLSDEKIFNKTNRTYFSRQLFKSFEFKNKKKINNIFQNKLLKSEINFDIKISNNKKNFSSNTPKLDSDISSKNDKKMLLLSNKYKTFKNDKKYINNITYSIDKLILDDMNDIQSNHYDNNYLKFYNNKKNERTNFIHRNNTLNIFKNLKFSNNKKPIIKQNGFINAQIYKIFNTFNSRKSNSLINKNSFEQTNSVSENYRYLTNFSFKKNIYQNDKFNKENNIYKNFRSYKNINPIKLKLKNNLLRMYNFETESNDMNLFNENDKKNFTSYKINKYNHNNILNLNLIKSNQYTNNTEINQILFVALNTLLKNFISEKLDYFIKNEEIKEIFDVENIIISLTNFDIDVNIYPYFKEFLLYLYLSNYINLYHTEFCLQLYKNINGKDYIDLNHIILINSFKNLVFDVKNIFESLKSDKKIMKEKLKENFNKIGKTISLASFVIFLVFNRNNFNSIFKKELLIDVLNNIDINFNLDTMDNGIDIEQYIKFRCYLTRNKFINENMKKEFISNFFNIAVFKNKHFDKGIFIIKLRPIFINLENIIKFSNKKDLDDSLLIDTYNKFINYFNF